MKYMFTADIHGNIEILKTILAIYQKEEAQKLVILGDLSASNHVDNEEIANLLNPMASQIEIIVGNCDNWMLADKLTMELFDIDNLYIGNQVITVTHGNRYNVYDLPPYAGNIFIQGHTHVPMLVKEKNMILANPGSPTRPRGTDLRCYLIVTETEITLKTLEGKIVNQISFENP